MGTSYTRQDVSNNIANGNVINADDLDAEFDAIEDAFAASTGHTHDGTSGEGGPVSIVGASQELTITGNQVIPKVNNTVDLGTTSFKFKDGYIDGRMYADAITILAGDLQGLLDAKQATDAQLTSFLGLTTAANKLPYFSGVDTMAVTDLSSYSRNLLAQNDANNARLTLGLGTMAEQDASLVTITGGSITGVTTFTVSQGGTGAVTAADARTNLGLAIGTNVQKYDATLEAIADTTDTGLLVRVDGTSVAGRTITAGSGISVTNGNGVSGNPTIAASGITTAQIAASTLVTASEGIGSNNNDTTIPTCAAVIDLILDNTWTFVSADQTITSGSTLVIAHAMPAKPTEVQIVLKCTTNQSPYVVGDEVPAYFYVDGATAYGVSARIDATNIRVITAAGGLVLLNGSGVPITLTNSSWVYVVRAR